MHSKSSKTSLRTASRLGTGLLAAAAAFLAPRPEIRLDGNAREPQAHAGSSAARAAEAAAASARGEPREATARFRIPQLIGAAHASMHVSTIANLTTVLRFKAAIMTKNAAEIASFTHKLHHEAAAARKSNDVSRIVISTKRLMVLTDALRERIEAMEKARK